MARTIQPLVYFRAEAPLITRAYYITRYACHRVTITSRITFFSFSLSLFIPVSLRTANKKLPYRRNGFTGRKNARATLYNMGRGFRTVKRHGYSRTDDRLFWKEIFVVTITSVAKCIASLRSSFRKECRYRFHLLVSRNTTYMTHGTQPSRALLSNFRGKHHGRHKEKFYYRGTCWSSSDVRRRAASSPFRPTLPLTTSTGSSPASIKPRIHSNGHNVIEPFPPA